MIETMDPIRGKDMYNDSMVKGNELIEALQRLISIKSVKYDGKSEEEYDVRPGAPFGKGIRDALLYTLSLCESFGMKTKNCNGYVGYAEVGEGDEMLGVLMHLDVVPEGRDWSFPPYGGEIHDGKLYGRGAVDDKGPAVAVIFALKSLMDSGFEFNKRVRLIFGADEESDWEDMDHYVRNEELPDMGFTPDADFPVIYGEMGILQLDIVVERNIMDTGSIQGGEASNIVPDICQAFFIDGSGTEHRIEEHGKAAHASVPQEGINAISKAIEKIHAIMDKEGCSDNEGLEKMVEFYHNEIRYEIHGESMGCDISDDESGRLTLNAGKIITEGNRIVLSLDLRCPVTADKDDILGIIGEKAKKYGLTVKETDFLKPVFSDRDGFLTRTLLEVYREETGDESVPMTIGGGTYARAMDNIVAFGPVFPWSQATEHMKDEHIYVEDLEKLVHIYAKAIARLCQ